MKKGGLCRALKQSIELREDRHTQEKIGSIQNILASMKKTGYSY
jgi:hypothetical protein